jgi:hypothetical protein
MHLGYFRRKGQILEGYLDCHGKIQRRLQPKRTTGKLPIIANRRFDKNIFYKTACVQKKPLYICTRFLGQVYLKTNIKDISIKI